MGLRKDLKKIIKELQDIKEKITPEIIRKAKEYDEIKNDLEEIKFNVGNISEDIDDYGNKI